MDVKVPRLGEGADSGVVVSLLVKEGDQVKEGQTILDPFTRQPFPGARIPSTRISPIGAQVLKLFPMSIDGASRYLAQPVQTESFSQFHGRLDHRLQVAGDVGVGVGVISNRVALGELLAHEAPEGAHLLLQIRTRTLNGDLTRTFRTWYPAFPLDDQPVHDHTLAA